jgi:hypothetical protein
MDGWSWLVYQMADGRWQKEEGRRKKEEGRRKKEFILAACCEGREPRRIAKSFSREPTASAAPLNPRRWLGAKRGNNHYLTLQSSWEDACPT